MKPMNFPGRKASRQKVALSLLEHRSNAGVDEKKLERRKTELAVLKAKLEKGTQKDARSKKDRTSQAKLFVK